MKGKLDIDAPIAVMGAAGMVGGAIVRALENAGWTNVLAVTRRDVDLCSQADTYAWYERHRPRYVVVAAARVGGIYANNTYPADFIYENLAIAANTIHGAHLHDVQRLLFLGSSCIYPKLAPQPMPESALLTGPLEPTNEAYAVAKIAGLKMCEAYHKQHGRAYFSAMPTNLYGVGDNFHPENSHVIPGLMRRFHEAVESGASEVVCWGSGTPMREFLEVDDLAAALLFLLARYDGGGHVNVGTGEDVTIRELVELIAQVTGYTGEIRWDADKPDGTPRKLMDVSQLHNMGWRHKTALPDGLARMYGWFRENYAQARR